MPTDDRSLERENQQLLDEAEALIWGLLDENIDAVDSQRLEELMASQEIRQRYLQCVELHSDLQQLLHSKEPNTKSELPQSPILGSLDMGSLGNSYNVFPDTNALPPLSE